MDRNYDTTESERPLDVAQMADLMVRQRRSIVLRDLRAAAVIVGAWGMVWLLGYIALWSSESFGGNPWFRLSGAATWTTVGVLTAAGIVVSSVAGVSMGRGRRGPSHRAGAMFGVSFAVGSVGVVLFDIGMLRAGLTGDQLSLLLPATFTALIGAMYMAGAGVTKSRGQYIIGVLLVASVVVATGVGAPHHLLVYAAAGLIFLVSAWSMWTGRVDD